MQPPRRDQLRPHGASRRPTVLCRLDNAAAATPESVEAGERAGHQHECEEPPRAPIPADLQPSPATKPRQRALHLPSMPAKPYRGLHSTPGDPTPDPAPPQIRPAVVDVVGFVGVALSGRQRRRPEGPSTAGTSSSSASSSMPSLRLAAVMTTASGRPPPSQATCSLDPGLPRSTGLAPTWSPHAWRARSWCPR
jgi:hypothetical protein